MASNVVRKKIERRFCARFAIFRTVQQLTLIAVVTAFLCAPGHAFEPHPQCKGKKGKTGTGSRVGTGNNGGVTPGNGGQDPNGGKDGQVNGPNPDGVKTDDDEGWIVLKAEDFAKNPRPGTKMKVFNQTGMSKEDARELCKKNNAVLADLHDVIAGKSHEYFPVRAHIEAHRYECPVSYFCP
ncbi:unnamed protein product [Nippostrongylus brasiliensis]|uniref:DUF732 domain-containing protein n=1 Tax=Nippostrongylus brasiliensis TaxID=27835 RepID=A0A158R256_NIPBR|nr:unnamed protein product [Nippostrongylus brasiliensis]